MVVAARLDILVIALWLLRHCELFTCHCEERSDAAVHAARIHGLPRFARNDGESERLASRVSCRPPLWQTWNAQCKCLGPIWHGHRIFGWARAGRAVAPLAAIVVSAGHWHPLRGTVWLASVQFAGGVCHGQAPHFPSIGPWMPD